MEFGFYLPPWLNTGMGDRLRTGKPPRYFTKPYKPTQLPTLGRTGNEYTGQSAVMLCGWEVKAGWLIPLVDKRVDGTQSYVIPR